MAQRVAVRAVVALGFVVAGLGWACAARLDEQQVRTRLVDELQLRNDRLRVQSITRDGTPVAAIVYGGIPVRIRFRRQQGVWVIDAVERGGRWEPADRVVRAFARELSEQARAREIDEMLPRYARTLRLLVGWSALLSADCDAGLPASRTALLDLHAVWHRQLFKNRGGEFHDADLFLRDGWWQPLQVVYAAGRIEVQSGGADLRLDTADDLRLLYTRSQLHGRAVLCLPRVTMPAFVATALSKQDAPATWNCAGVLQALTQAGQLDVVADR